MRLMRLASRAVQSPTYPGFIQTCLADEEKTLIQFSHHKLQNRTRRFAVLDGGKSVNEGVTRRFTVDHEPDLAALIGFQEGEQFRCIENHHRSLLGASVSEPISKAHLSQDHQLPPS